MHRIFRSISVTLLCLCALVGCKDEPTYVFVTVEAEDGIMTAITELSFESNVVKDGASLSSDIQTVTNGGNPIRLPQSFVILANGWGKDGETVSIVVEANPAEMGEPLARARGTAIILKNMESSTLVTLRAPCTGYEVCLDGASFCENPSRCVGDGVCDGPENDTCSKGTCVPIATDDDRECTEYSCNDATATVAHTAYREGDDCGDAGDGFFCGGGLCKVPECGDSILDLASGETCDEGLGNDDEKPGACRTNCQVPSCGDGVVDVGPAFGVVYAEECDEGQNNVVVADNSVNEGTQGERCRQTVAVENPFGVSATLTCALPRCGDGVLNGTERCDDHNSDNGDGCNPTCSLLGAVSLVIGESGGQGDLDGAGEGARLRPVQSFASDNGIAYFSSFAPVGEQPHVIRQLDPALGSVQTIAGTVGIKGDIDGIGTASSFSTPRGLALLGSSLFIADRDNHKIKRLDLNSMEVETVAGTGQQGSDDTDVGLGIVATLAYPQVLAARGNDEILIFEGNNGCLLRHFRVSTGALSTLLTPGSCFALGLDFSVNVRDMLMVGADDLYVTDGHRLMRIALTDDSVNPTTVPPSVVVEVFAGDQNAGDVLGVGTSARFNQASGIGYSDQSPGDFLYLADKGNDSIKRINLTTREVERMDFGALVLSAPNALILSGTTLLLSEEFTSTILAGDIDSTLISSLTDIVGKNEKTGDADASDPPLFSEPHALAIVGDSPSLLFVSDQDDGAIRAVNLSPAVPTVVNLVSSVLSSVLDNSALVGTDDRVHATFFSATESHLYEMTFQSPSTLIESSLTSLTTGIGRAFRDIAVVPGLMGNPDSVFVTLAARPAIYRLNPGTSDLEIFSGTFADPGIVDGSRFTARFGAPHGLVSCGGNLYVSEILGSGGGSVEFPVIREIDFSMSPAYVTTIAGFPTDQGHVDGFGLDARFDNPRSIACDDRDPENVSLYVADVESHVVRQIELSTRRVTTLAGTPYFAGSVDGVGLDAGFNFPQGITFDPVTGDLYLVDKNENIVRRIQ